VYGFRDAMDCVFFPLDVGAAPPSTLRFFAAGVSLSAFSLYSSVSTQSSTISNSLTNALFSSDLYRTSVNLSTAWGFTNPPASLEESSGENIASSLSAPSLSIALNDRRGRTERVCLRGRGGVRLHSCVREV
jgi:hypothetical protein